MCWSMKISLATKKKVSNPAIWVLRPLASANQINPVIHIRVQNNGQNDSKGVVKLISQAFFLMHLFQQNVFSACFRQQTCRCSTVQEDSVYPEHKSPQLLSPPHA